MPLLCAAIERIIDTYKSICETSINGIWGNFLTPYPPPLTFAAEFGKPNVATLLLKKGADPSMRYCSYRDIRSGCTLARFAHGETREPMTCLGGSSCQTALTIAMRKAAKLPSPCSSRHQDFEDCALVLRNTMASTPYSEFLLKEEDDCRDVIEYLVKIGAPLLLYSLSYEDDDKSEVDSDAHVYTALDLDHPKTAIYFLALHIQVIEEGNSYPACSWLIEQGISTTEHMQSAIEYENKEALLLEVGWSDRSLATDASERMSPLEIALTQRPWRMAYFLISKGADPALVSAKCKTDLHEMFEDRYGVPYDQNLPLDKLQLEYIAHDHDGIKRRKRATICLLLNPTNP
ncbi:hypothetical protein F5Y19DRAFT_476451 [Xylariaceae sp. FL1651]|nr:hypothetical protein F5Y19DRAFT_476451 [Xylariaceae sp. FL1651]